MKRTHEFKMSNVKASMQRHPKLWVAASFVATFVAVVDVVNTLKKEGK